MDALYQNALLYAIGWAILHSFWQLALTWMTFQVLFGFRKNSSPDLRYLAAVAVLGVGALLFMLTGLYEYQHALAMGPMLRELTAAATTLPTGTGWASLGDRVSAILEQFMPYLSSAYLIILFFLAARLWSAWLHTRDIRKHGLTPLNEPWTEEVRNIARQLGLDHVGIFLSDRVQVPVTLGHLRPLILLPVAALNYLTIEQARAVLLHEIAHIRRRDYLVNIGVSVIGTLLFFNPFVHALITSLRRDREMCCDDFVLQCRQDAGDYARALLSLEQFRISLSPAMAMAATGHKGQLLNRVRRILDMNNGRAAYGQRLFAFLFLAGLLSTLAWMAPDALNGPGMDRQGSQITVAREENGHFLKLSVSGNAMGIIPEASNLEQRRSAINFRQDLHHEQARIEESPVKEYISEIPAPLNAPLTRLQTPELTAEPFFSPDDREAHAFFEMAAPAAPFISFTPVPRPWPGQMEMPSMVFISPDGRDMINAMVNNDVKVEFEKTFKQMKGFRIDMKEFEQEQAAMSEAQQRLIEMRLEKNDKKFKDWQKRIYELKELATIMHKEPGMPPNDILNETIASDPEAPVRVMDMRNDHSISWSDEDRSEQPGRIRATRPRTEIRYKKLNSTLNTTVAISEADRQIFPYIQQDINLNMGANPGNRPQRAGKAPQATMTMTDESGGKGIRVIVVEQEPRNIEIRLERD